jgi:hypothetical protein
MSPRLNSQRRQEFRDALSSFHRAAGQKTHVSFNFIDQLWGDVVSDNHIESYLAAGMVNLLCDSMFALRRPAK